MDGHLFTRKLVVALTALALLGGCAAAEATPSISDQTTAPTSTPSSAVSTPTQAPTPTPAVAGSSPIATTFSTSHPMLAASAGWQHTCAIRTDNTLACWGQAWVSPPNGTFAAVSAGIDDCAIRADGALACWGNPGYGEDGHELRVPQPTGTFTAVSVGDSYACAIRTDGTVACWLQSNASGDFVPAPVTGQFIRVTAGDWRACGIRADGTLACWGSDGSDQATPTGTFVAVSEGSNSTCAIRTDGTASCWTVDDTGSRVGVPTPTGSFSAVSQAGDSSCALRSDGTLTCWGAQGYDENGNERAMPTPNGTFTAVSVGVNLACAVRTDGIVECWGEDAGQAAPGPVALLKALPLVLTATDVALEWSSSPLFAPVTSYDVRYWQTGWDEMPLEPGSPIPWRSGTTETKGTFTVSPGYSYEFEVQARDAEGTLSDWAHTATVTPLDDRTLMKSAGWTDLTGSRYYRSTALRSFTYGAKLTLPRINAGVGILATTCPTCGAVEIYFGSELYEKVSLHSSKTVDRALVYSYDGEGFDGNETPPTLTIKVVSRGKPVIVDAVVIPGP